MQKSEKELSWENANKMLVYIKKTFRHLLEHENPGGMVGSRESPAHGVAAGWWGEKFNFWENVRPDYGC